MGEPQSSHLAPDSGDLAGGASVRDAHLTPSHGNPSQGAPGPTLDDLFRRTALRNGLGLAVTSLGVRDPAGMISFAQAENIVSNVAMRLRDLGLPVGATVAVQLSNRMEAPLLLLGILRAGMVAALLPLLWRRNEMIEALGQCSARALIVDAAHVDDGGHFALEAAAEAFSIRHVCGLNAPEHGAALADGIMPLDELFTASGMPVEAPLHAAANPAAGHQAAIITFESMAGGLRPVARSHAQIIAGGLAVFLEAGMAPGAQIASTIAPMSFAGLCCGLMPWLLSGGALMLAQPDDPAALIDDIVSSEAAVAVLPGPLALSAAAALARAESEHRTHKLRQVVALWRQPEQVAGSADWNHPRASLIDVQAFGEAGLLAGTRTAAGQACLILPGQQNAPRFKPKAVQLGEAVVSPRGTLVLRGPMVAAEAYAQDAAPMNQPRLPIGCVDTGYRARVDARSGGLIISAPPPGLIAIGGCRMFSQSLQRLARDLAGQVECEVDLTALPDRTNGHRLIGRSIKAAELRILLQDSGFNVLINEAFRERRSSPPQAV